MLGVLLLLAFTHLGHEYTSSKQKNTSRNCHWGSLTYVRKTVTAGALHARLNLTDNQTTQICAISAKVTEKRHKKVELIKPVCFDICISVTPKRSISGRGEGCGSE